MRLNVFNFFYHKRHIKALKQHDSIDCGPTCLKIISLYYNKNIPIEDLVKWSCVSRNGVSLYGINLAAKKIGFDTESILLSIDEFIDVFKNPCIIYWNKKHFMVCYKIRKSPKLYFYIVDPAQGFCKFSKDEFLKFWGTGDNGNGVAFFLEPNETFVKDNKKKCLFDNWRTLLPYTKPYKINFIQIFFSLLIISILGFIFPILTQNIVDKGIEGKNVDLIFLIILAQFCISITKFIIEFIRSWILLHINYKINILFISDFLYKLIRLPLSFFDSKNIGDIMQRIDDNSRIEQFLTGESFIAIFSFFNFIVFSILLAYYKILFLWILLLGNIIYLILVFSFMKYRRELDNRRFAQSAGEQAKLIQLITGMPEVKLNNCEKKKRWEWEKIQSNLYKIGTKSLLLAQIQKIGSLFFNQAINLIIIFIAAKSVVNGELTIGIMMAIMYIVGQLSVPIEQIILFFKSAQDANISIERLNELKYMPNEYYNADTYSNSNKVTILGNIQIKNVWFSYNYPEQDMILKNINLNIPANKVTAIVGTSGSGKTTLIKLMLGFYKVIKGEILVDGKNLQNLNPDFWRNMTSSVMQEGFIFSDTIAENIALSEKGEIDINKVIRAAKMACIHDYINNLALKYDTKIGMEGAGLSQGQKQRILIARVIYKNPSFIFLDEATNALDANNEKKIMNNLKKIYSGKTTVIVAHRLSTVKDADNIVVIEDGEIIEQGNHEELTQLKGKYYKLVKNQLELGS